MHQWSIDTPINLCKLNISSIPLSLEGAAYGDKKWSFQHQLMRIFTVLWSLVHKGSRPLPSPGSTYILTRYFGSHIKIFFDFTQKSISLIRTSFNSAVVKITFGKGGIVKANRSHSSKSSQRDSYSRYEMH